MYQLCRRQIITVGQGQQIDLSIPAVKIVMDLLGVVDQRTCLQRVRALWHEIDGKAGGE